MTDIITKSSDETQKAGSEFAAGLNPGDIVLLYGELGSGKTQFVKGICEALGVTEPVNSPTFIIVNEYSGTKIEKIYHFDLYRIKSKAEVLDIGFFDYISGNALVLIEWPEVIGSILLEKVKRVYLSHIFELENRRRIKIL